MATFSHFSFNGRSSLEFALLITEKGSHKGASRDVTYTSVPGRSGDLITDNGRYKNINIQYKLTLLNDTEKSFEELARQIKAWLLAEQGYFRLTDSYDPNYFRLASYSEEANIEQELREVGSLSVKFNCKPFKYSFAGQEAVTMTEAGVLTNAEQYEAAPYIKITGSGAITLYVNNEAFAFTEIDEYIEIDSEIMNAFKGTESRNSKMASAAFPTLRPGDNAISWDGTGTVEKVEIIPRWCCL